MISTAKVEACRWFLCTKQGSAERYDCIAWSEKQRTFARAGRARPRGALGIYAGWPLAEYGSGGGATVWV